MGRYTDQAPVGNTCPIIDEVIAFLENIEFNLDDEDESDLDVGRKHSLNLLERIRTANQTLREWGNEMYQDREYWEKDSDEKAREIISLQEQIISLEKEYES